ncbi:hypothetical protein SGLAM104S_09388 [Streptomyces glaucescens]
MPSRERARCTIAWRTASRSRSPARSWAVSNRADSSASRRRRPSSFDAAVAAAAELTPAEVMTVVLGCTHYELVAERIRAAVQRPGRPPLALHGSAGAVAAQALRRIGARPDPETAARGDVTVLLSGRPGPLPAPALSYAEGRLLAPAVPARWPTPADRRIPARYAAASPGPVRRPDDAGPRAADEAPGCRTAP